MRNWTLSATERTSAPPLSIRTEKRSVGTAEGSSTPPFSTVKERAGATARPVAPLVGEGTPNLAGGQVGHARVDRLVRSGVHARGRLGRARAVGVVALLLLIVALGVARVDPRGVAEGIDVHVGPAGPDLLFFHAASSRSFPTVFAFLDSSPKKPSILSQTSLPPLNPRQWVRISATRR